MRRILVIALLALTGTAVGQSLGDAAREARQKEKARAKTAKKVITNEDIPESPESTPAQPTPDAKSDPAAAASGAAPAKSAREWRRIIVAQMDDIETLRTRISELKDSIHFVTANAYVNGAEYNQYQVRKQQEVKNLEKQLEERSRKLTETQEAARKEGMGAAVYEP